jgi:hypothetical protein
MELRRVLGKFIMDFRTHPYQLIFATKEGKKLSERNLLRDVKALCVRLGFEPPRRTVHATRHTFSIEYLRRGGSLFHLQKMLGHETLDMVRRYASLVTAGPPANSRKGVLAVVPLGHSGPTPCGQYLDSHVLSGFSFARIIVKIHFTCLQQHRSNFEFAFAAAAYH